jgi:hypothetical protein
MSTILAKRREEYRAMLAEAKRLRVTMVRVYVRIFELREQNYRDKKDESELQSLNEELARLETRDTALIGKLRGFNN